MNRTDIPWTDYTWNPVTGCSRISDGCRNCYAEALSLHLGFSALPWTAANAAQNVRLHPERLDQPRRVRRPARVFVCSMADLFHEQVPDAFLARVFAAIEAAPWHTFQVLTKRAERMARCPPWPANVWAGVSVESRRELGRLDHLRRTPAAVRFVSFEPLLEDVGTIDLGGISWAIVGGESGPSFRPMLMAWARSIRDQCLAAGVRVFFKQDAGPKDGFRPWIVEPDGRRTAWGQFPDAPPQQALLEGFA